MIITERMREIEKRIDWVRELYCREPFLSDPDARFLFDALKVALEALEEAGCVKTLSEIERLAYEEGVNEQMNCKICTLPIVASNVPNPKWPVHIDCGKIEVKKAIGGIIKLGSVLSEEIEKMERLERELTVAEKKSIRRRVREITDFIQAVTAQGLAFGFSMMEIQEHLVEPKAAIVNAERRITQGNIYSSSHK